jgi:hypothetical protein
MIRTLLTVVWHRPLAPAELLAAKLSVYNARSRMRVRSVRGWFSGHFDGSLREM